MKNILLLFLIQPGPLKVIFLTLAENPNVVKNDTEGLRAIRNQTKNQHIAKY